MIVEKENYELDHVWTVFSIIAASIFAWDLGNFAIVWFVSFKYWETSRQFTRVIRLLEPKTGRKSLLTASGRVSKVKFNDEPEEE